MDVSEQAALLGVDTPNLQNLIRNEDRRCGARLLVNSSKGDQVVFSTFPNVLIVALAADQEHAGMYVEALVVQSYASS